MPAPSASNTGCCSSPTPSNNTTSAWRKSTTGSGPSTLIASCSHASTNATTSSGTDTLTPTQCYPCSRFTLLPMFPVAQLVDPCGIRREPGQRNHSKAQGTIRRSLSIVARRPTINDTVSAVAHYLKDPLRPIVAEGTVRPHGPVARLINKVLYLCNLFGT